MRYLLLLLMLVGGGFCGGAASAHSYQQGAIRIGHIWARATPAGATTAAVYLPLFNTGTQPDRLLGAATPAAQKVQIHRNSNDNGVVKMRMIEAVDLPPNQPVALSPNGTHLMLIGLTRNLQAGDHMPLTLTFEKAGSITVDVMIEPAGAIAPKAD